MATNYRKVAHLVWPEGGERGRGRSRQGLRVGPVHGLGRAHSGAHRIAPGQHMGSELGCNRGSACSSGPGHVSDATGREERAMQGIEKARSHISGPSGGASRALARAAACPSESALHSTRRRQALRGHVGASTKPRSGRCRQGSATEGAAGAAHGIGAAHRATAGSGRSQTTRGQESIGPVDTLARAPEATSERGPPHRSGPTKNFRQPVAMTRRLSSTRNQTLVASCAKTTFSLGSSCTVRISTSTPINTVFAKMTTAHLRHCARAPASPLLRACLGAAVTSG